MNEQRPFHPGFFLQHGSNNMPWSHLLKLRIIAAYTYAMNRTLDGTEQEYVWYGIWGEILSSLLSFSRLTKRQLTIMFSVSQHSLRTNRPVDSSEDTASSASEYDPMIEEQSSDVSMAIDSSLEGQGQEGEGGIEESGDEDEDGDGDEQPSDVSMAIDSSSSVEGQGEVGEEGIKEGGRDGDGDGEEEEEDDDDDDDDEEERGSKEEEGKGYVTVEEGSKEDAQISEEKLESEEVDAQSRRVMQFPLIPESVECIKFPDDTSDDESEDQSTSSLSRQISTGSEGQESDQGDLDAMSSDPINLFNILSSPLFRRSPAPGPEGTGVPAEIETDRIPDFVHLFARFDLRKKYLLAPRTVRPALLVEIKKYETVRPAKFGPVVTQVQLQAAHMFGDPVGRELDVIGSIIGFGPLFTYVEFKKAIGKRGFVQAKFLPHSDPGLRALFGAVEGRGRDYDYKSVKFVELMSETGHAALGAIKKRTVDLHEEFLKWTRPRIIEEIPKQVTSPVISNASSDMYAE